MKPIANRERNDRIRELLSVGRIYRGCSQAKLAHYLDRDPAKIAPDSGNPKLDLLFNLADLIDWDVGDLAEAIWGPHASRIDRSPVASVPEGDFRRLDELVREAHRRGDYAEMRTLGEHMLDLASTPLERAGARMRIGNAWVGEGRFAKALKWLQAAADEREAPPHVIQMVRINLASAHLALFNLVEAEAIAHMVLSGVRTLDPSERRTRVTEAHAWYVVGAAQQRAVQRMTNGMTVAAARAAIGPLRTAQSAYEQLLKEFDDPAYAGVANTCRGAILEMEAESGDRAPEEVIQAFMMGLDEVVDPAEVRGDMLESWGWWCVSGLMLSLRHLTGEPLDRAAAVFSNKAFELAEATNNWSLRERAFSLGHLTASISPMQPELGVTLDEEDLRSLVGTMGRFPRFRETAWEILLGRRKVAA